MNPNFQVHGFDSQTSEENESLLLIFRARAGYLAKGQIPGPSSEALFLQSEGGLGHHPSLRLLSELRAGRPKNHSHERLWFYCLKILKNGVRSGIENLLFETLQVTT
jgi:hypothetical protein